MELDRLPAEVHLALSGAGFRARRRLALPFLTVDPGGFPRAALLTLGEVRARSRRELVVAVRGGSRTAANLIRRRTATLFLLARNQAVWVQAKAGRGHVCDFDPDRQIFPLAVVRVKVDRAAPGEEGNTLAGGPTFTAGGADRLFSEELYAELGGRELGR
jgi:hypothetical protein